MALNSDLSKFFESSLNIDRRTFPEFVRVSLIDSLKNNNLYKSQRMRMLVAKQEFSDLEWLEWFGWYFVVAQFPGLPQWFSAAKAVLTSTDDVRVMSYPELLDHGWKIIDIVTASVLLSDYGIENYHSDDKEISHWCDLRSKNLTLFSGAVLAGELIGQVGFIKLDAREYDLLRKGDLEEEAITGVCEGYKGPIYLYVPSVVISLEWRKKTLLFKLFMHLLQQLEQQQTLKNNVAGLIALAYTEDGASLCQKLGLRLEKVTATGEGVYTGQLSTLLDSLG